jgi:hypothetical protein
VKGMASGDNIDEAGGILFLDAVSCTLYTIDIGRSIM